MLILILEIFAAQIVVIAIIVAILKKILDRQLVEMAIHKLEVLDGGRIPSDLSEVIVITPGPLAEKSYQRIFNAILKKTNKKISVVSTVDRTLKGGIIIKVKDITFDHSLVGRLKEADILK